MSWFMHGIKAKTMSTELVIEANVSKKILFEALDLVRAFEARYSAYKEDSLVGQINAHSGVSAVTCSDEELEIFTKALEVAKRSNGAFDPTIGALTQGLYGFGTSHAAIPDAKRLKQSKKLVDYKKMKIYNNEIFLQTKGMRIDLGGIGKGYIADKVMQFLRLRGATKALVNAGGEIITYGKKFRIGIQNPFEEGLIGVIESPKEALSVSTSGDYERFIDSKEHHHILDNISAKQNHYYRSITLLKEGVEATWLDGVATVVFNAAPKDLEMMAERYEVAIIAITPEKEILMYKNKGANDAIFDYVTINFPVTTQS